VKDKLVPVRERGIVAPYIVMWSAEQDLPFKWLSVAVSA